MWRPPLSMVWAPMYRVMSLGIESCRWPLQVLYRVIRRTGDTPPTRVLHRRVHLLIIEMKNGEVPSIG